MVATKNTRINQIFLCYFLYINIYILTNSLDSRLVYTCLGTREKI